METVNKIEMFCHEDIFFDELGDWLDTSGMDKEEVEALPDDYTLTAYECDLQPVFHLNDSWILDRIRQDRLDEDGKVLDEIDGLLLKHIDFNAINEAMPKLYYRTNRKVVFTKAEMLECLD